MKQLQNGAAFFFIICVVILAVVSVMGVWEFFDKDVIYKSLQTIGLLATVSIVIIGAGRVMDARNSSDAEVPLSLGGQVPVAPNINPIFTGIRRLTVVILIISITLLALLGVLSIWEVLSAEVLSKSLSTMGIIAFACVAIVMTCLEREQHKLMHQKMSGGFAILLIILAWSMLSWIF